MTEIQESDNFELKATITASLTESWAILVVSLKQDQEEENKTNYTENPTLTRVTTRPAADEDDPRGEITPKVLTFNQSPVNSPIPLKHHHSSNLPQDEANMVSFTQGTNTGVQTRAQKRRQTSKVISSKARAPTVTSRKPKSSANF